MKPTERVEDKQFFNQYTIDGWSNFEIFGGILYAVDLTKSTNSKITPPYSVKMKLLNLISTELERVTAERDDFHGDLCKISEQLCGIKIGEPLEGIDEPETDVGMVYSFVEGTIDKQAYRADKAEAENADLKRQVEELQGRSLLALERALEIDELRAQLAEATKDKFQFAEQLSRIVPVLKDVIKTYGDEGLNMFNVEFELDRINSMLPAIDAAIEAQKGANE